MQTSMAFSPHFLLQEILCSPTYINVLSPFLSRFAFISSSFSLSLLRCLAIFHLFIYLILFFLPVFPLNSILNISYTHLYFLAFWQHSACNHRYPALSSIVSRYNHPNGAHSLLKFIHASLSR